MSPKRRRRANAVIDELRGIFPAVFGDRKVPLKIGVDADLLTRTEYSEQEVRDALTLWTRRPSYLTSIIRHGSHRHDLDGIPGADVTDEERASAREHLAEHHKRIAEKRKQQELEAANRERKEAQKSEMVKQPKVAGKAIQSQTLTIPSPNRNRQTVVVVKKRRLATS